MMPKNIYFPFKIIVQPPKRPRKQKPHLSVPKGKGKENNVVQHVLLLVGTREMNNMLRSRACGPSQPTFSLPFYPLLFVGKEGRRRPIKIGFDQGRKERKPAAALFSPSRLQNSK